MDFQSPVQDNIDIIPVKTVVLIMAGIIFAFYDMIINKINTKNVIHKIQKSKKVRNQIMKKCILTIFIFTALLGMTAGCSRAADVGKDRAAEIALDDAGFTQSDITRLQVSGDNDDGERIYEVEFTAENTEYEYEIQASDGDILNSSYDTLNTIDTKNQQETDQPDMKEQSSSNQTQTSQENTQITIEEASKLALDRVPGSSEKDLKIELDFDDGIYKYEGDIIYNQMEYEFEIDANTGNFLEWNEDRR